MGYRYYREYYYGYRGYVPAAINSGDRWVIMKKAVRLELLETREHGNMSRQKTKEVYIKWVAWAAGAGGGTEAPWTLLYQDRADKAT